MSFVVIKAPVMKKTIPYLVLATSIALSVFLSCKKGPSCKECNQNKPPLTIACDNSNRPVVNAQLVPVSTLPQLIDSRTMVSAGNKIFFAGGEPTEYTLSPKVDIYDVVSNTWSTANLSKARVSLTAIAAGSKVFFAGGVDEFGTTDVVDIYDMATGIWTVSHLSLAGENIKATTVGDKVLFAGGVGSLTSLDPRRATRVDIYNLTTASWSTASLSEQKWRGHNAVTVNNKVYIAGGASSISDINGLIFSNKIDIYDNTTNTWSTSTMQEARFDFAGVGVSNKVYWAGGTCAVEIRDVSTNKSLNQYLFRPSFIRNAFVKDNTIVFLGDYYNSATNSVEHDKFDIYDTNTNTWFIGAVQVPLPFNIANGYIVSANNSIYIADNDVYSVSGKLYKLEF
jgi:hypothetical protein